MVPGVLCLRNGCAARWDDRTRHFEEWVDAGARRRWNLEALWDVVQIASGIARLQVFSTEVARLADGRWIVVDYVNDPIDLRLRSHAREGMPVEVADHLAEAIARCVAQQA